MNQDADVADLRRKRSKKPGRPSNVQRERDDTQSPKIRLEPEETVRGLRRDHAVEVIRDLILMGAPGFKSGDIVSENQLAERLGLTKAPIRQALIQLGSEGLVSTLPRLGTQVRVIRPEEVQAMMTLRFAIETIIVGELTRTNVDVSALKPIHAAMQAIAATKAISPDDISQFIRADLAFHARMAELADGYSAAANTVRDMTAQIMVYANRTLQQSNARSVMKAVNKEHGDLLKAIESGNVGEATDCLHAHLRFSVKRLAAFAASYVDTQLNRYLRVKPPKATPSSS